MLTPLRVFTLLVLALACMPRRGLRWLRVPVVALAAGTGVMMTPFGANALVALQESRLPPASPACASSPPQTIVVLSGGMRAEPRDAQDHAALGAATLGRLFAAIERYRLGTAKILVMVGTSGYAMADGDVMADLAQQLGVPASALRVERKSLTTWQNARRVAELDPPLPVAIGLATSALHLPRAVFAFRRAGFEPCPIPTGSDYRAYDGVGYLLPTESAAVKAERAMHELIGDLAYRAGFASDGG